MLLATCSSHYFSCGALQCRYVDRAYRRYTYYRQAASSLGEWLRVFFVPLMWRREGSQALLKATKNKESRAIWWSRFRRWSLVAAKVAQQAASDAPGPAVGAVRAGGWRGRGSRSARTRARTATIPSSQEEEDGDRMHVDVELQMNCNISVP